VEPVFIKEVKNSVGVTIYKQTPWKYKVIDESTAYVMSDMLHSMFMAMPIRLKPLLTAGS